MYQLPILPKCVSSQLKQIVWINGKYFIANVKLFGSFFFLLSFEWIKLNEYRRRIIVFVKQKAPPFPFMLLIILYHFENIFIIPPNIHEIFMSEKCGLDSTASKNWFLKCFWSKFFFLNISKHSIVSRESNRIQSSVAFCWNEIISLTKHDQVQSLCRISLPA